MTSSVRRKWEVSGLCLHGNPPCRQKLSPSTMLSSMGESNRTLSIVITGFACSSSFGFLLELGSSLLVVFSHPEIFLKELLFFGGIFILIPPQRWFYIMSMVNFQWSLGKRKQSSSYLRIKGLLSVRKSWASEQWVWWWRESTHLVGIDLVTQLPLSPTNDLFKASARW